MGGVIRRAGNGRCLGVEADVEHSGTMGDPSGQDHVYSGFGHLRHVDVFECRYRIAIASG